jgi:type II secretory pathway pseudopilin PulG
MKILINIVLVALIVLLAYMLYSNIKEPIAFQDTKNARSKVVVERLQDIRTAQEIYRDIKGQFAASFDSLEYVLKNDSIPFENIIGDPDDPTNMDLVVRTVTYSAAIDTIRKLQINLDSLRYVPFAPSGTEFTIDADTLTYQQSLVAVVEVGTRWKEFMGPFGSKRYAKYDSRFDPENRIKFGDMSKPNLTGNWE